MSDCEATIVRALTQADPYVGLDHEGIWQGYLDGYSPKFVSRVIARLRRRGVIEAERRGWYRLANDPRRDS